MADVRVLNGDSKEQVDSLPTLEEATLKTAPMPLKRYKFM